MKRRMLVPLLICALALAGCYRQAEEPIQQVSGSEAIPTDAPFAITTPIVVVSDDAGSPDASAEGGEVAAPTATSLYVTPETLPGQVEQPTVVVPTAFVVAPTISDAQSTRVFILPTPTLTFAEQLDPADECVYSVVSGDTLFRLSLVYGTTVEDFFSVNGLDSDALSIGQLLLIPGCEPSAPPEPTDEPVAEESPAPVEQTGPVLDESTESVATDVPELTLPLLQDGLRIHVVSAGETFASIALRYGVPVEDILSANGLEAGTQLSIGQELEIPDDSADEGGVDEPVEETVEDESEDDSG